MTARSRTKRPPSLDLSFSSREHSVASSSSSTSSSSPDDSDSDGQSFKHIEIDDGVDRRNTPSPATRMNMFAAGPYCFKQPTLMEVLSNTAPPPYTLPAFTAYLSQNHCLETLEFIMDANRYQKHYLAALNHTHPMSEASEASSSSSHEPKDRAYVRKLWEKLLEAYIIPNAPREVNLPCTIRDRILSIPNTRSPPPPECLNPAVEIIHELMQESVLVPFLSECQNQSSFCMDPEPVYHGSLDERFFNRRKRAGSPADVPQLAHSYTAPSRTASPFSPQLGWARHATASSWSDASTMDDSMSSTPSWGSPMTPPTTPPTGDIAGSPKRAGEKAEKGWKRMTGGLGRGLGFGKKKEHPQHPQHPQYW